jgi:dipeptidase D
MNPDILQLEPRPVWQQFAALNAVPRPSKKEQKVIEFMRAFGKGLGLDTRVDGVGNVIIRKPASAGMEDRETVVMQGHLDMVHQKNAGTVFDFDTQGIEMVVEDDWVSARGTTLGADNGIGVAAIMAVLASGDLKHPSIEALFTVDEETGMTGAKGLQAGQLSGGILLNLDTEDDREICIGCAGGIDVTVRGSYAPEQAPAGRRWYRLVVRGLTGGHSGMDIHRGRANANQLLVRLLLAGEDLCGLRVSSIDSGGLRNAIPREGSATVSLDSAASEAFEALITEQSQDLRSEFASTDPDLDILLEQAEPAATVLGDAFQFDFLRAVSACPCGIYRMSPEIDGLVQTSNSLARVRADNGEYELLNLTRGSVDSEKMEQAHVIRNLFELIGAQVEFGGEYPGWAPRPGSAIVQLLSALYRERFGEEAPVVACHAGLECGIIGTNYPEMQMISFGPNIRGAHSPDEKVQVSSVQKFWGLLLEVLQQIPLR